MNVMDSGRHWLQRSPLDFTCRLANSDWDDVNDIRDGDFSTGMTVVYEKLALHLCFFINGKLQLFRSRTDLISQHGGLLCVPSEVVEFDADNPGQPKLRRPEQDMSIHDLILSMLQDEIRSGVLRSVQFMDFAYDDPLILRRTEHQTMKGKRACELRALDLAVILSLDPTTRLDHLNRP